MRAAFLSTQGQYAGWVARFALHGHTVALAPGADPVDITASQLPGLYDRPLPAPGAQIRCDSVEQALAGADWVWTDVPLADGVADPGAIIVGPDGTLGVNAIDPVDLIPTVELFGPDAKRAAKTMKSFGLDPAITPGGVLPALSDAVSEAARKCVAAGASAEDVARLLGHGLAQGWALGGPFRAFPRAQRDGDLTSTLRALKWQGRSVGRALLDADLRLGGLPEWDDLDLSAPILTMSQVVPADWADYNGHMTEARYLDAFGRGTDRFMMLIGCDAGYIAAGQSFFTAETHICHLAETKIGEAVRMETQLLAAPGRKMHILHKLWGGDTLRATGEHVLIHVSLETRRATPFGDPVGDRLAKIATQHAKLPRPDQAGRAIR